MALNDLEPMEALVAELGASVCSEHLADVSSSAGVEKTMDEVDARWSGSPQSPIQAAVLRARGVSVLAPGLEPISLDLEAWGKRSDSGVELRRLRAMGVGWRVAGSGVVGADRYSGRGDDRLGAQIVSPAVVWSVPGARGSRATPRWISRPSTPSCRSVPA